MGHYAHQFQNPKVMIMRHEEWYSEDEENEETEYAQPIDNNCAKPIEDEFSL